MIRKAEPKDISRIAEILVFTKRMKYRAIFHIDDYSFNELQVVKVANEFKDPELLIPMDAGEEQRSYSFLQGTWI